MNTDIHVILLFLEYILLFMDVNVMKNRNNFQITKVQPKGVA